MAGDADVRAAIAGDREAFERLYKRYFRAVFVDLVARVRRSEDAEDALQATFLAAWMNLERLAKPERFVAWLFRIARNKARDQMRRKQTRLVLLGRSEDLIAPTAHDTPDVEALRELMSSLRTKTRAIVLLRVLEGWSAEEVAAAQGLSASTVRRRYAKALRLLRTKLAGRMKDDGRREDRASHQVGL